MSRSTDFESKPDPSRLQRVQQRLAPYVWACVAVAAGVLLRSLFTPEIKTGLPFVTLFPAVFIAAYLCGLGPGILATLLGALAGLHFFIEPIGSLSLANPIAFYGVLLFTFSGGATAWLGEARLQAHRNVKNIAANAERETARAEQEALRAEEEAARAEEESARAEEEMLRAEEESARAEQEAQGAARASERVERILASITDAFTVLDHNWTITYMNEPAAEM